MCVGRPEPDYSRTSTTPRGGTAGHSRCEENARGFLSRHNSPLHLSASDSKEEENVKIIEYSKHTIREAVGKPVG